MQPIVIARDVPNIVYNTDETLYEKMKIEPEKDLYREILTSLII